MPSSLHLVSETHYCCSGDVVVDATATVGAGTVLQALPGSAIRIAAGACIGSGVVIQARGGTLVVAAQASLGMGVLLVGQGQIGRAACIGASSTLIDPVVPAGAAIAPNSLDSNGSHSGSHSLDPSQTAFGSASSAPPRHTPHVEPRPATGFDAPSANGSSPGGLVSHGHVYGRQQLNGLLSALFPHRQPLNGSAADPADNA